MAETLRPGESQVSKEVEYFKIEVQDGIEEIYAGTVHGYSGDKAIFSDRVERLANGLTPQQFAQAAHEGIIGFRTFQQASVEITTSGITQSTTFPSINHSSVYWIDGEVWTLDEFEQSGDELAKQVPYLRKINYSPSGKIVRVRTGSMRPFGENDTVISSQPQESAE